MTQPPDTSTLVVPPAIWRTPRCPACSGVLTVEAQPQLDTSGMSAWGCDPCGLSWPDGSDADGKHTIPSRPLCETVLRPFEAGLNRQPSYRDAVYLCIRPEGHQDEDHPAGLCAGFLIAGSDGIPRSRTWRADLAVSR